jgi:hypothetical protein
MKCRMMLISVASLLLAGVATAAVQQGDLEVSLAGQFRHESYEPTGSETFFEIQGRVGYFMTDNIQVGGLGAGDWGPGDDSYRLGIFGSYHFMPANQLVPYVGGQAAYQWQTGTPGPDGLMYGPLVGVRFELNPRSDLFVEYQYRLFTGDLDDQFRNMHAVVFGIITQFR